jgi:hypothetical protein
MRIENLHLDRAILPPPETNTHALIHWKDVC